MKWLGVWLLFIPVWLVVSCVFGCWLKRMGAPYKEAIDNAAFLWPVLMIFSGIVELGIWLVWFA